MARQTGPNTAQGTGTTSRRRPRRFNWGEGHGKVHTRAQRNRPRRPPAAKTPNRYKNPLYDPTAVLSGKSLGRAADALVNLEFNPQRAALDRAEGAATTQGTALLDRAGSYYRDLAGADAGNVARQDAIGAQLQQALKGISDTTQGTMQQAGAGAGQRAAQDAAVRGSGLSGGGDEVAAAELAAQRGNAAQDAQRAASTGAEGTADYKALADLTARSTAARGGEVQQQLLNRLANQRLDLQGQRQTLESSAAGKRTEQLLNLRQSGLENLITEQGLNIKQADLQARVRSQQTDQRLAARRQREVTRSNRARERTTRRGQDVTQQTAAQRNATTRRGQDIGAQQRAADRRVRKQIAAGRSKPHRNESTDSRKQRLGIANAVEDLQAGHEHRVRRDAPPLVYRAAKQISKSGFVGPETIRMMRAAGIRIPRSWLPPGKKGTGAAAYNKGNVPG